MLSNVTFYEFDKLVSLLDAVVVELDLVIGGGVVWG